MKTILNVDDNDANRYVKTRLLRGAGFEVAEAATGEQALALALERQPALALLDIKLPDIDGIEVCRRLRADARTATIPVIHISATHVTPRDQATSLGAGADLYLAEPVAPHELSSAVRTLVRLRDTEQGLAASEARLRLAIEAAGVAPWELELSRTEDEWIAAFGAVHPDDRARVAAALGAARAGRDFREEFRVATAEGRSRWVAARGRLEGARLIGVSLDVTARKESELEREALKDEFLAVLSHELRTPMSAMMGWLHLLKSGRLGGAEQREALETVERNARVQTQLINDLLDVSRIVTGKMELDKAPFALDRALDAAVESARPTAAAHGLEIARHAEPGDWTMLGNAERVHQVFSNLLSNAIKFSPPGRHIEVRLRREGAHGARVEVADQGEGIAAEALHRIFERFRQADSSTRRRHGGLGLGLAIVRSLVELHGGSVEARSDGPGRGACFVVRLPLQPPQDARDAAAALPERPESLHGLRVLVVDDDESNREMIATLLRLDEASVTTASDPAGALAACDSWRPDVLVLDIGMPEMDGYELLPKLRERLGARPADLPALAVSGFAAKDDMARSLAAGFQAHLAKPFEARELTTLIAGLTNPRDWRFEDRLGARAERLDGKDRATGCDPPVGPRERC